MNEPYFTVAELRARYPEVTVGKFDDARVAAARDVAEQTIEDACGVAFVVREDTVPLSGVNDYVLRLPKRNVRALTDATDQAGDTVDLTDLVLDGQNATIGDVWPFRLGPVTVTYTHGLDAPPARIKQAAMLLTRTWLVEGPVSARATQIPVEGGGSINLATPGVFDAITGVPEVDAAIMQYERKSYVA